MPTLKPLLRWVAWVSRHPRKTFFILAVLTLAAGYVALDRYSMNSRLGDLVQQDADWRDDYDNFQKAFPQLVETAIVMVSGTSYRHVEQRARDLEAAIRAEPQLFVDVFAPANASFFSDNALLYLDLPQLDNVADQLAQAQPMLAAVSRDPSLGGVLKLVADGASQLKTEPDSHANFLRIITLLQNSAMAALAGRDAAVPWRDEFFRTSSEPETLYRLIFLRGKQNYGVALPNEQIVLRLRELIEATKTNSDVAVALTGEIALRHDEVEAATGGVKVAGSVAMVLLGAVLAFGVRSLRIVLATFAVLLVGVVWTSAWALLSVGSFNTLSLVFLVMFFGLGVDFCVHYSLRVQEAVSVTAGGPATLAKETGLRDATVGVGGAIVLCTLTTAIGFLGFLPTPYKGLADLGVISAGGMVVACILTFTLLPAIFAEFGLPRPGPDRLPEEIEAERFRVHDFLQKYRSAVFSVLVICIVGSAWFLPRMQFDYSVLALRDPDAESMLALRELQREKQITDYALYTLSDPEDLERQKSLADLDTVGRVITPFDYLPKNIDDKLFVLEDLEELLGGSLRSGAAGDVAASTEFRPGIERAANGLRDALKSQTTDTNISPEESERIKRFASVLDELSASDDRVLNAWQSGVVDSLLIEMDWLERAVAASPPAFSDLPPDLQKRLVAPNGQHLTAVLPAYDITPVDELNRFIDSVRSEAGNATGRPVVEWGVGNIVLGSFKTALIFALGGISLTLLLVLRSFRDTLLVLTPLMLAALFTVATSVLLGVAINMASVLVLPLIFGLGVDNGIHMVERYRAEPSKSDSLVRSSTPRAVLLSTLTTIGTFSALMLSPHAGTASIGFLLTVAVSYLLLFTLYLLPLLLSLTSRYASRTLG